MLDRYPRTPLRVAAAMAGTLALALSLAGSASAQSAADDEDVPLDTKIFRQIMKDLGMKRGDEGVEYRERAPLVVPPSRELRPPQPEGSAAAANPAWPKDPDAAGRRKQTTAAERAKLKASAEGSIIDEQRPLRPDELDKGRTAAAKSGPAAPDVDHATRPLSPDQLGQKKTFFDSIWSSFGPYKPESVPFNGEPPRTSMTAPPPGYQTPSAEQPYGLGIQDARKATTVVDRVEPKN
ncbi:MAG: hypothetical protein ABWY47_09380 [Xanthobacteraceae bacterium]|jgi:hypothetical protein